MLKAKCFLRVKLFMRKKCPNRLHKKHSFDVKVLLLQLLIRPSVKGISRSWWASWRPAWGWRGPTWVCSVSCPSFTRDINQRNSENIWNFSGAESIFPRSENLPNNAGVYFPGGKKHFSSPENIFLKIFFIFIYFSVNICAFGGFIRWG